MTDPTKKMPRTTSASDHDILLAAHKTIPLSRIAVVAVSSDVTMKVRFVDLNGNTASGTMTLTSATASSLLGLVASMQLGLDLTGSINLNNWPDGLHWVSLQGNAPFYLNGGANPSDYTVTHTPDSDDWTIPANTEVRLP